MTSIEEGHPAQPTRRAFCVGACQAASCAALGLLLQACGGGAGSPTGPTANISALPVVDGTVGTGGVQVAVSADPALGNTGGAVLVRTSQRFFLLARTGQDTFSALSAICTHQACTITGYDGQTYFCPCHGSEFSTSGRALTGPAVAPLQQFPTTFANDTITITAEHAELAEKKNDQTQSPRSSQRTHVFALWAL